jgi:hypothetical protein
VDIVNVNIDGVPVRFENSAFPKQDRSAMIDLGPSLNEKSQNDWVTWVKVNVGDQGGLVTIDYVVNGTSSQNASKDLKGKAKEERNFDVLIPTFALPVGRLEVTMETSLGKNYSCIPH